MTRRGVKGEPMADVTEADRTKALLMVGTIDHHSDCLTHWDRGDCNCGIAVAQEEVAVALAEEREKARAPFLALIPKLQEEGRDSGEDPYRAGLDVAAEWIREIAEETE